MSLFLACRLSRNDTTVDGTVVDDSTLSGSEKRLTRCPHACSKIPAGIPRPDLVAHDHALVPADKGLDNPRRHPNQSRPAVDTPKCIAHSPTHQLYSPVPSSPSTPAPHSKPFDSSQAPDSSVSPYHYTPTPSSPQKYIHRAS